MRRTPIIVNRNKRNRLPGGSIVLDGHSLVTPPLVSWSTSWQSFFRTITMGDDTSEDQKKKEKE
jgi:hypothetical protein